jgi:hypothetical protein
VLVGDQRGHLRRRVFRQRRDGVRVGVQGDAHARVAEPLALARDEKRTLWQRDGEGRQPQGAGTSRPVDQGESVLGGREGAAVSARGSFRATVLRAGTGGPSERAQFGDDLLAHEPNLFSQIG